MNSGPVHFLDYIFADTRAKAEQPILCEKQGAIFQVVTRRETSARIADFARALYAAGIGPTERVVFYAAASPSLLIGEWATLASRGIAVIVPRSFSADDLAEILAESKARIAIVDRLATAYHLHSVGANLPDLKHIVCLEGAGQGPIPVWSWNDFLDSARMEPDRSAASLRAIAAKDTALLFYYKDASGMKQASRYSHELVLGHLHSIDTLLGKSAMRKDELVLTAHSWEQPIGHIAACYAPVPREAMVQITYGVPDVSLFENSPQVTVGDAVFFDGIRENIQRLIRQSGPIESAMLAKAVALAKPSYESGKLKPFMRLQKAALQATIVKKVRKMLGDRLRLLIGTDDDAPYETQLFFHTFGVELIELPQEAFK